MHVGKAIREGGEAWPSGVGIGTREWVCVVDLNRQPQCLRPALDTYKVVHGSDDRSLDVPNELRHCLTVWFIALSTKLGGYDTLAGQVGWPCKLTVRVNYVVEPERLTLWAIDRRHIC
jgi:hypothetical protein